MARTKNQDTKTADLEERRYRVLELRRRGLSLRKIAEQVGVSYVQVRNDIEHVLTKLADENRDKGDELRQLELVRLDAILEALDHWVQAGNPQSVAVYLKAMERRAKLLGLDAPTKQDIHIDDWRSELVDLLKAGKISPDEVIKELGTDLATELFKSAGIRITSG